MILAFLLGAFRKAYRSAKDTLPYTKTHYFRRDIREYEEFKAIIGAENMPKTLAEFQQMKYNEKEQFAKKEIQVKDERIRCKLGSADYPLKLHVGKQGKHIKQHNNFQNESYLAVNSVEEGLVLSQAIVDEYHGKGKFRYDSSGNWAKVERIMTDRVVGFVIDKRGQFVQTKAATIHYSKTGTHIVPTIIEGGKKK